MSTDKITLAQISIPYFTGIPTDVITNSLHFIYEDGVGTPPSNTNYAALAAVLLAFENNIWETFIAANWVNVAGTTVTMYDLTQPTPRVPVYAQPLAVTATKANSALPTEVAVCMSYAGTTVPGIPPARQRGRIFLGGMAGLSEGTTTSFPNVGATARGGVCDAADQLQSDAAAVDWTWIVYSPAQHAVAGQESFSVSRGWVDNTPDTQRRRGVETSVRTVWAV